MRLDEGVERKQARLPQPGCAQGMLPSRPGDFGQGRLTQDRDPGFCYGGGGLASGGSGWKAIRNKVKMKLGHILISPAVGDQPVAGSFEIVNPATVWKRSAVKSAAAGGKVDQPSDSTLWDDQHMERIRWLRVAEGDQRVGFPQAAYRNCEAHMGKHPASEAACKARSGKARSGKADKEAGHQGFMSGTEGSTPRPVSQA